MGCGNVKLTVEASIDDVTTNPTKGLPNLLTILNQSGKDSAQQESVKRNVPRIFELLPKAMESLNTKDNSEPVFATYGVIEQCAKLHNEQAAGGAQPTIDVEYLRQCQQNLVVFLKKAQEKASQSPKSPKSQTFLLEGDMENDEASKEVRAIALATAALFKLKEYSTECKQEFKNSGGIVVALEAMEVETSGINCEAMQALAEVLSLFVDSPWGRNVNNVETILENGGHVLLARYVESIVKDDVSGDMLLPYCRTILEACLRYGKDVKHKDVIQTALEARPLDSEAILFVATGCFERQ